MKFSTKLVTCAVIKLNSLTIKKKENLIMLYCENIYIYYWNIIIIFK